MIVGSFPILVTSGGSFEDDRVHIRRLSTGGFGISIGDEFFTDNDVALFEILNEETTPARSYYDGLHGLIGMFAFGVLGALFGHRVKSGKTTGTFSIHFKDGRTLAADY